jgi:hypothetical protein
VKMVKVFITNITPVQVCLQLHKIKKCGMVGVYMFSKCILCSFTYVTGLGVH